MRRLVPALVAGALVSASLAGCSNDDATSAGTAVATSTSSTSTSTIPPTTSTSTTSTSTSTTTSTSTSTTSTTTPLPYPDFLGEEVVGTSIQGRPMNAMHRGTPGGVVILVVGVIHGDEDAGMGVVEALRTAPLPPGIDLWLLDAMNPDGWANQERGNANGVDLNRNFPHDWTAIAQPGEWEYSGTGPASEPETQAFIAFAERIKPELTLWYH
ncbi:MAG TPA: DUF2817 domain-containing protein, partial [Ilumatobacteraceae bacterium]|nr:DUF2817 domain-containing protein [Ilumatobacteraceae bacterium]